MKRTVRKLGRTKLVIIISLVFIIHAVVFDLILALLLDHEFSWTEDFIRASIVPVLITPFIFWYLIGLFFKLEELQYRTKKLATFDSLTKVFNRGAFLDSCKSIHKLAKRNKQPYCFIVLDIDYFKRINDEYGHPCGDKVLTKLGKLLKSNSRKSDVIGRLGGEEFGLLLPETNKQQAEEYTRKLQHNINSLEMICDKNTLKLTVSLGLAVNGSGENITLEETYCNADKALYSAKESGRDQFVFYSE